MVNKKTEMQAILNTQPLNFTVIEDLLNGPGFSTLASRLFV